MFSLIILILLFSASIFPVYSINQVNTYSIAYGDWGIPTPFHHHRGPSYVLTSFIWDTLVWRNETGIIPLLAYNWTCSTDGLTWIITLRKGVKWHDGVPFTAEDVAFTMEYLKKYPYPFGASDVAKYVKDTIPIDDTTVKIILNTPYPDFIDVIMGEVEIIPKHIWENVTDPLSYVEKKAFIGTGPYKLIEYKKGEYYLLKANDDYFLGKPLVKKLYLNALGRRGESVALALKSKDVDAASFSGSEVDVVKTFEKNPDFKILEGPSYWVLELIFNCKKYPFSVRDFRIAIAYAIDRVEIVDKVLHGGGIVASLGITHPDSKWYNPNLPSYSYNLNKASDILDKLGFIDRNGDGMREFPNGTKLSFTILCAKKFVRVGELIKSQLSKVGLEVTVKPMDWKPMDDLLDKGLFSAAITGHGGISHLWPGIKSTVDWPAHTYENPTLDDLLKKFYTTLDEDSRRRYAYEIQDIIAGDLPVIALYHPKTYCIYRVDKPVNWFWTKTGIAHGIPIWWNKLALVAMKEIPSAPGASKPIGYPIELIAAVIGIIVVIIAGIVIYIRRK